MDKSKIKITVLGAGISGLATSYWLHKEGFNITVLEARSESGGAMQTEFEDGFLIDYGPNSGLETTPLIKELVDEIGLKDEMIYANEEGNKRYILKNDKLHALPMNPPSFIKTKLFSSKAKFRLMAEPFISKSSDGYYQSIAEFVKRRLGQEFLDYAIDPFVSGVFAGDPNKLSVKSAFPKLYRLEELYGGLFKGMIKGAKERKKSNEESKQSAKMFSFKNGMQSFPRAIADNLQNKIKFQCDVDKVLKENGKYKIAYKQNDELKELETDIVLSTIPSFKTANVFQDIDKNLSEHLNDLFYPPVMVLYVGYKKEQIKQPLDGFGFLIPSKEKKSFLGAIWSSTIFVNRANHDSAAFTLFVGGARKPDILNSDKQELIDNVIEEFKSIMQIDEDPIFIKEKLWSRAIPQYNIGYIEHENYFEKFELENPGLFLSGNYRGGISVGDCVKNSEIVFNRIKNFTNNLE